MIFKDEWNSGFHCCQWKFIFFNSNKVISVTFKELPFLYEVFSFEFQLHTWSKKLKNSYCVRVPILSQMYTLVYNYLFFFFFWSWLVLDTNWKRVCKIFVSLSFPRNLRNSQNLFSQCRTLFSQCRTRVFSDFKFKFWSHFQIVSRTNHVQKSFAKVFFLPNAMYLL